MPDDTAWRPFAGEWGLVLGASSGFGAATARELGRRGMGVIGAHLDRKVTLPQAEAVAEDVRAAGSPAHFFNVNAADDEKRVQVCERARELTGGKPLRVLLHSLAFGTLKPFVSDVPDQQTTKAQLEMTLDVMAHSLVYWVQDLHARGLLGEGSHVCARAVELLGGRPLCVFMHSLAFGTLKPFVSDLPGQLTSKPQLEMTLDVMAHSLVYWVQDLYARRLLGDGSHVFAMTSSGGTRVMPFYGAVSAANAGSSWSPSSFTWASSS